MVQLGELQEYYGAFHKAGVVVYAVSVDAPEDNARLKARLRAGYEFLSDAKGELLDALDIHQRHWAGLAVVGVRQESAVPTQYLLDRAGIVRWLSRAETWRVRPEPTEALQAIQLIKPCETLRPIGSPA